MLISARYSASLLVTAGERRSDTAHCSPLVPVGARPSLAHKCPAIESARVIVAGKERPGATRCRATLAVLSYATDLDRSRLTEETCTTE